MKINVATYLAKGPTPQDVYTSRQSVEEFLQEYGRPVVFKHRWNFDDLQRGLTKECPYKDGAYHRDKTDCPYCFGTGFLGGFSDGQIVMAVIADAPVDQLKVDSRGYILFERHPQLTAPWYPTMGDGDLLIEAEFDWGNWEVLSTQDRFELKEVRPITLRGTSIYPNRFWIQQTSQLDRIMNGHVFYNVPIVFNYDSIPQVQPPIGLDPDDYSLPYSTLSIPFLLIGSEAWPSSSINFGFKLVGLGSTSNTTQGLRLTGTNELGATIIL